MALFLLKVYLFSLDLLFHLSKYFCVLSYYHIHFYSLLHFFFFLLSVSSRLQKCLAAFSCGAGVCAQNASPLPLPLRSSSSWSSPVFRLSTSLFLLATFYSAPSYVCILSFPSKSNCVILKFEFYLRFSKHVVHMCRGQCSDHGKEPFLLITALESLKTLCFHLCVSHAFSRISTY